MTRHDRALNRGAGRPALPPTLAGAAVCLAALLTCSFGSGAAPATPAAAGAPPGQPPAAPTGSPPAPAPAQATKVALPPAGGDCGGCPDLAHHDSALCALLAAPDPAAFAAERRLGYADGAVRAEIELESAEVDLAAFAAGYGLAVEATFDRYVQARVPLDSLCALAGDPRVVRLNAPIRPAPQGS